MKLKAILDNLDGIDEALKAAYTDKDGKFYLNVEGFDPNETEVLRNTMRNAKAEKKAAEKELADLKEKYAGLPDDFSVDEYNTLKDASGGKIDQRLADQRNRLTAEKDVAVKKVTEERDSYKSRVEKLAKENAINAALAEVNITNPAMQKAAKAMFMPDAKVDFENDAPIVTIDNLPVADKLKAWAATDEGKHFVAAPGNGGGGAGGGQGGGTADYSKMTDTQLMMAQDKDPRAKTEMEKRTKIEKPAIR